MDARTCAVKALAQIIGCHLAEIARGEDEPELTMQIVKFAERRHGASDLLMTPYEVAAHTIAKAIAGTLDMWIGMLLYGENPGEDHYVERVDELLQEYAQLYGDSDDTGHRVRFEHLEQSLRNAVNPIALLIELGDFDG